jgi:N-acyl-D-amino-acid deacylase
LVVAPGFIDAHTHSDLSLLAGPGADTHVSQGVTTNICGCCGNSAFPARGARADRQAGELKRYGLADPWEDLPGYLKQVESVPAAINRGLLVGHGAIRASVMGYAAREASADEMEAMRAEVSRAMELGCLGLSSGLIYPPGVYSTTEELIELARIAAGYGGLYASHVRSEGKDLEASVQEFIRIADEAGVAAQFSHLKVSGQEYWPKIDFLLDSLEKARARGLRITADRYPYTASETSLDILLPVWAFEGGHDSELSRLRDKATRSRLAREVVESLPDPAVWERVVVGSIAEPRLRLLQGRTVAEIAAERGVPPVEAYLDVLNETDAGADAMFHKMSEEHLERILQLDWVMLGSDSSAREFSGPSAASHPHPRGCGACARLLARYVREKGLLSLPEAVRRMTSLPAATFGLLRRGRLARHHFADVAVFDPARVTDKATYRSPKQPAEGMVHVFVNGRPVMLSGKMTGQRPGRVLKREDGK